MRTLWLARLLLPVLLRRVAHARDPDFTVVRDGGEPYLHRWWVWRRNRWCNLYLHQMLRDDDAVIHDHPYASLSLVLTDGLRERFTWRPDILAREVPHVYHGQALFERWLSAGHLVYRSRHFAHQLIVDKPEDGSVPNVWTLFLTGPRLREWGFWCPRGWRPWHEYVATSQDSSGAGSGTSGVGRGCGEVDS